MARCLKRVTRSLNTSASQRDLIICNTTPVRYFALVGQFDLLVSTLGGRVPVPRQVLDLDDDPDQLTPTSLLSEIGRSERYWAARSGDQQGMEKWDRLRALRSRTDIEVVDLSDTEVALFADVSSEKFARSLGLAGPLGSGEAAVIAIAETRGWYAALDDFAARTALTHRQPGIQIWTSRDLLRQAVLAHSLLTSEQARIVYWDMLAAGYRGPPELW